MNIYLKKFIDCKFRKPGKALDLGAGDLVYSNYVLHKLKNKGSLIQTAFDNLRKGGWFFLHVFDRSDPSGKSNVTAEFVKHLLIKRGFKSIVTRIFSYYDNEEKHKHWHKILETAAQK